MNSSKFIVLNTSASFSSLRIENVKKAGTLTKDSESNLKLFLSNIPLIDELFTIQTMVGEGTFSKVYKARHKQSQIDFALKCIIPTIKPSRIIPELRYLRDMGGDCNIIEIKTCLFESGYTIIVMPFFQHDRFSDYIKDMDIDEIKEYMRNLLVALKKVHSNGVIHRDIKPNNFLYNRTERRYALVDFGLAQYESDVLKASKTINRVHSNLLNSGKNFKHKNMKNKESEHHHHHQNAINSMNGKETPTGVARIGRSIQTANSLFKSKDKMVCVRKRFLTFDNDDENMLPHKIKKVKHDWLNQSCAYKSASIFHTPPTPFTDDIKSSFLMNSKGAMQNMTNLQSTPTLTTTANNLTVHCPVSITPLCFNAIPNFNFDSVKPLTPDNSSIISNNCFALINNDAASNALQTLDTFRTPTKQRPSNAPILGQLQNSPNSIVIPETPPKSSHLADRKAQLQMNSFRLNPLMNASFHSTTPSSLTNATTFLTTPTTNLTTSRKNFESNAKTLPSNHHLHNKSNSIASLSNSMSNVNLKCKCFGQEQICKICTKRNECMAPRAGTPGFRAPEVLFKHLCQTSAIDIWSAGVIFASLITRKYPFFRNTDDMTSLAEIISIFGTERVQQAAQAIGKQMTTSEKNVPSLDLKEMVTRLRGDQMEIEDSAFDLFDKLLDPNPLTRIKASDALDHPFLRKSLS